MNSRYPLLSVRDLEKTFPVGTFLRRRPVHAVNGVSFAIASGETLGLVGESGSGKSTIGRMILNLTAPTGGAITFAGADIARLAASGEIYRKVQIIFQDPHSSLHPRLTVRQLLAEPLRLHGGKTGRALESAVERLLDDVGLAPELASRYPHQFSGGQRQRIGIARALACEPELIVCDEPVSALDVSVQAQIINLLKDLQEKRGLSYLFIAHDLAVVRHISHRIAVLYLGEVVESAPSEELFSGARHPYSQALLAAIPRTGAAPGKPKARLRGEPPSPIARPAGCAFRARCSYATDLCGTPPPLRTIGAAHLVACHHVETIAPFAVDRTIGASPRLAALMRAFAAEEDGAST
ncbi:MAG: ABC transporter ATP-binding protein [Bosea sp.]|jgi:oligopeptide/dipeptide ABC transporter ATP-binding protein|uniref:ABC transporter ATP-binding protein n=1 Tax=Hyphomicrobiales TaxID=356 RepID=UPI0008316994|nr:MULTISPECIES: ABC transporter ATP-binding protein [Hyphomicrobiales]MCP4561847.1 ABC transporter ATP-binding protein [Bosea sp. (in: a-proteobacteria)]MCP4738192.1 ABC transporter ATP-binding protein [Bosea sp. (in: a-proteobacteria)]MDX3804852.1 ABC transporter ATP-binding protein [Bosea sp. (in: a-proteobacteria)]